MSEQAVTDAAQESDIAALGKRLQELVMPEIEAFYQKHPGSYVWAFNLDKLIGELPAGNVLQFFGLINK